MRSVHVVFAAVVNLAISGCAVLTVDVDVYKGALANHESVQNEQVAAMAMGAKPLLIELRLKLEQGQCKVKTPGLAVSTPSRALIDKEKCPNYDDVSESHDHMTADKLKDPDARRVNDILSLYKDSSGPILAPVAKASRHLLEQIEDVTPVLLPYVNQPSNLEKYRRAAALATRAIEDYPFQLKPRGAFHVPEPNQSQVQAIKRAWSAGVDVWHEAIRVLSSVNLRTQLAEQRRDTIYDVAWVAADLTSGEGIREFLNSNAPMQLKAGPLMELAKTLPILSKNKSLRQKDEDAVAAVIAQMLADEKQGPALASHLLLAQGYATTNSAQAWFIALYPAPRLLLALLLSPEIRKEVRKSVEVDSSQIDSLAEPADPQRLAEQAKLAELAELDDLRLLADLSGAGTTLAAGRPNKGIETLIDDYLRAQRSTAPAPELPASRSALHNGLINFAEKVTIIANFDPLLRDGYDDARKYVQVLQAIGNSILSQVDALKQSEAHQTGLARARETEINAIRNAEARATAALNTIAAELKSRPSSFPGKVAIETALTGGRTGIDTIVAAIEQALTPERGSLQAARVETSKWDVTAKVLAQKEIRDAIERYQYATVGRSTAEVAAKIASLIEKLEGEERRLGGDDSAQNFQLAASALKDPKFISDTGNAGEVDEKFRAIELEINRQLAAARKKFIQDEEKKWSAAAGALRRKDILDSVTSFGKAEATRTVSDVAKEIIRALRPLEAEVRRRGGPADPIARNYQTAAAVLGDATFVNHTANPGNAIDKLRDIEVTVSRQLDAARKVESPAAGNVVDLERWRGLVVSLSKGGLPSMKIPKEIANPATRPSDAKPVTRAPDAKDVLDVMLATLRYEHVNATREHGPDSPITRNLAAAVELNFAYRSGMIHIRPASTFLRNSYPATVLQQDPAAGFWRNMLTDHAERQLPFYESVYTTKHEEEIRINKAIDKQFWQSVNQVRVSGAGRTNYAIAKDDVGNWYVKSYSSNPEDIIKSAKNLALFSAGNAMGANFLARGGQRTANENGGQVPTTREARSTLGKQLDLSTQRYTDTTKRARDKLRSDVEGLENQVKKAVITGGVRETDFQKMDAAKVFALTIGPNFENLTKDRDEKNNTKSASALNSDIGAALLDIKKYRNEVAARLAKVSMAAENVDPKNGEVSFGAIAKANQAVEGVVKDLLARNLKERQTSTAQYESALLLIGESSGLLHAKTEAPAQPAPLPRYE